MLQLGSRLAQFHLGSGAQQQTSQGQSPEQQPAQILGLHDFLKHVRKLTGVKKENVFLSLRIPNQHQPTKEHQPTKDDIGIVILTGQGVFCIDTKPWRGRVSARGLSWHVEQREQDQTFNTSIEQVEDPLKAITTKAADLCQHLKRNGVSIRQKLFFPKVVFLSPECELDDELKKRRELVSHGQMDTFLASFREGYVAWMSDALTPSWLSGHLSYGQMAAVQDVLSRVGTWDLVKLRGGEQLKGDFQSCQYVALDRRETDTLEFSRVKALSSDTLWALLGHVPQVTVKMFKRGAQGWLSKPLNATTTIPSNTQVMFRICGEDADAKIPANNIHSITLSI